LVELMFLMLNSLTSSKLSRTKTTFWDKLTNKIKLKVFEVAQNLVLRIATGILRKKISTQFPNIIILVLTFTTYFLSPKPIMVIGILSFKFLRYSLISVSLPRIGPSQ